MTKPTQGPWTVEYRRRLLLAEIRSVEDDTIEASEHTVAEIGNEGTRTVEQRSNARFIAAAPDMFDVLQHIEKTANGIFSSDHMYGDVPMGEKTRTR